VPKINDIKIKLTIITALRFKSGSSILYLLLFLYALFMLVEEGMSL